MLWCEKCRKEFADSQQTRCPHCGGMLQKIAPEEMESAKVSWGRQDEKLEPSWPRDKEGTPEPAAFLCESSHFGADGEITISMLRAFGIPVLQKYPGDGQLGKVVLGFSGYGVDLYVPESMLELAQELLASPEEEEQEGDR
ncbi:MAG: hypothetical protein IIY71_05050 [Oscillospiraceae bacterium]|nr:hypothetical protein [Oscillospiraceae bacterium]